MTEVTASRAGDIIAVRIDVGDTVRKNQEMLMIGSPELNTLILAIESGVIESVFVKAGDRVSAGQLLFRIKPIT